MASGLLSKIVERNMSLSDPLSKYHSMHTEKFDLKGGKLARDCDSWIRFYMQDMCYKIVQCADSGKFVVHKMLGWDTTHDNDAFIIIRVPAVCNFHSEIEKKLTEILTKTTNSNTVRENIAKEECIASCVL